MNIDDLTRICDAAICHFGERSQYLKVIEECAELAAAMARYQSDDSSESFARVVEEAADVSIVLMQLQILVGKKRLESEIERKGLRLLNRINAERVKTKKPVLEFEPNCNLCRGKGYVVTYWPIVDGKPIHDEEGVQVECSCKQVKP